MPTPRTSMSGFSASFPPVSISSGMDVSFDSREHDVAGSFTNNCVRVESAGAYKRWSRTSVPGSAAAPETCHLAGLVKPFVQHGPRGSALVCCTRTQLDRTLGLSMHSVHADAHSMTSNASRHTSCVSSWLDWCALSRARRISSPGPPTISESESDLQGRCPRRGAQTLHSRAKTTSGTVSTHQGLPEAFHTFVPARLLEEEQSLHVCITRCMSCHWHVR